MEGSGQEVAVAGKGGVPATPRWNPTKDQISILEGFYRDGVKTPNAEQIEEITRRLKEFGEIECKNVFYWFQNHKARIRQKQKQDSFAIFNPFLLPPNPHVICSPYYMAQTNSGFYPNVIIPDGIKKRPRIEKYVKKSKLEFGAGYGNVAHFSNSQYMESNQNQETLDLFPVHPTGILQDRRSNSNSSSSSSNSSNNIICLINNID